MNLHTVFNTSVAAAMATGLLTIAGCGSESSSSTMPIETPAIAEKASEVSPNLTASADTGSRNKSDEVHSHKPGSHGGIIISIGSDSYHAEAIIEQGGNIRLMLLGKDESRIQEVDIQPVKAYIKANGDSDAMPIELSAVPQDGDAPDMTSQFVGRLPGALQGRPLDVTIPNLRIAGERFRVGFTTVSETHADEMPASLPDAEESELYLTAGGQYADADIKANGNTTASQKFKGVPSSHDMFPTPGDRICPITETKANANFTWIVGGKPYQFCCPPCVDEFVRIAKESEEKLKDPEAYVKPASSGKDASSKSK